MSKPKFTNAHLIAASPAMYAVIEQIVRYQRSNKGELQEYMNNSKLSFEKLLAKARGEYDEFKPVDTRTDEEKAFAVYWDSIEYSNGVDSHKSAMEKAFKAGVKWTGWM